MALIQMKHDVDKLHYIIDPVYRVSNMSHKIANIKTHKFVDFLPISFFSLIHIKLCGLLVSLFLKMGMYLNAA